jgi:hypothetical protein
MEKPGQKASQRNLEISFPETWEENVVEGFRLGEEDSNIYWEFTRLSIY